MQALHRMKKPAHTRRGNVVQGPAAWQGVPPPAPRIALPTLVDALLSVGLGGLAAIALAALAGRLLGLSPDFPIRAAVLVCLAAAIAFWFVATKLAPVPFGAANRLTSLRALGVALVLACVGERGEPAAAWAIVGFTILLLILDGFDGRLARRDGHTTAFGARFDMETDAALTLALAILCWQFGKAGPWILAVGLMRYAFVAASLAAPWLARPLPYSRRRQTICIVQLSGLLAVLSPLFPVPASTLVGIATLLLLAASFAVDIDWLSRDRLRYG